MVGISTYQVLKLPATKSHWHNHDQCSIQINEPDTNSALEAPSSILIYPNSSAASPTPTPLSGLSAYRITGHTHIYFFTVAKKIVISIIPQEKNDNKALIHQAFLVGFSNSVTEIIKHKNRGRRVKLYIVIATINLIFGGRTRSEYQIQGILDEN